MKWESVEPQQGVDDFTQADALVDFARRHQVTQILLARGRNPRWKEALGDTLVLRVVGLAKDMRVTVVADRRHRGTDLPAGRKG